MGKCKYPNEICANMTVLNGNIYCDSIPCSLKDEIPKQTNADRIRAMSDEELARFIHRIDHYFNYDEHIWVVRFEDKEIEDNQINILEWLQN